MTRPLTRRHALALLGKAGVGAVGLGTLAAACSNGSSDTVAATTTPATTTATTTPGATTTTAAASGSASSTAAGTVAVACTLTPEVTEGPYYLDTADVRGDITEGRPGTPLELKITVVDVAGCRPITDAAVDIWHCDAIGTYSGVSGNSGTFLRGTQLTDTAGLSQFTTIYPGWYQGRAVHIHMKVHVGGSEVHTGQLFFDDSLTDAVYQASPYSERGTRNVLNAADRIYRDAGAASAELTMAPSGDGYVGTIVVGVSS